MTNEYKTKSLIEFLEHMKDKHVPEKEQWQNAVRFLEFKAREKLVPLHGHFELTPFCNLNCKMCYIHLNGDQFDKFQLLTVDTWKKLINQAHSKGMIFATLTGGECLMYPQFEELYLYLWELGIKTGILTNGVLLTESQINFFKHYPPYHIQVSLYGSSDNAYEKVTGKRVFGTVKMNLEHLRDAHLPLDIAITPNRFMADDVIPILELVEALDIPYNINSQLISPRKNTGRETEDFSTEQYIEIFKERRRLSNIEVMPLGTVELPDENHEGTAVYGLKCGAGRSNFVIRYDGKMSPCVSMDELTVDTLKLGFCEAWKQINSMAKEYPLPVECADCAYHNQCSSCAVIHKNAPNPGHCDPRICERTKAFIRAGLYPLPKKK